MKVGARSTTGWRATIAVAMSNYIEAGSIIAIATSLAFWQGEFGISNFAVGLLAALSAEEKLHFGTYRREKVIHCTLTFMASFSRYRTGHSVQMGR